MKYYGNKLYTICSIKGSFVLAKDSVYGINYLKDIKNKIKGCVLLVNKDYLSSKYLYSNEKKQFYVFRKSRKKSETLFFQFCGQFMIRRDYAKFFHSFNGRILS